MLYMIVERFKAGDAIPLYRRLRDQGRLTPEGLEYVSSWVDQRFSQCFQLMRTGDPRLVERWIQQWSDLADFEVVPVITSEEAREKIAAEL